MCSLLVLWWRLRGRAWWWFLFFLQCAALTSFQPLNSTTAAIVKVPLRLLSLKIIFFAPVTASWWMYCSRKTSLNVRMISLSQAWIHHLLWALAWARQHSPFHARPQPALLCLTKPCPATCCSKELHVVCQRLQALQLQLRVSLHWHQRILTPHYPSMHTPEQAACHIFSVNQWLNLLLYLGTVPALCPVQVLVDPRIVKAISKVMLIWK